MRLCQSGRTATFLYRIITNYKMKRLLPVSLFAALAALGLSSCQSDSSRAVLVNGLKTRTIPGLAAVDVYGNFEKSGFVTVKALSWSPMRWTSKRYDTGRNCIVTTLGTDPNNVISVDAAFLSSGPNRVAQEAASFLGFAASIPYQAANQQAAKAWAVRTASAGSNTTIGKVNFSILVQGEDARLLRISM